MIVNRLISLLTLLALTSSVSGQDDLAPPAKKLGSQDLKERQEATKKLWAAGHKSSKVLKKAAASDDPEIARRAHLLLNRIKLNLTPETPESVVLAMDQYWSLNANGRIAALKALKLPDYALTLLRVWSEEKNLKVKDALEDNVSQSLDHAINSQLAEKDFEGARELLELFPDYPKAKNWLAGLYQANGTIGEEIAELEAAGENGDLALLLSCYRRSGNFDKALELARKLKNQEALASLSLLAGDSRPYLDWCEKAGGQKKQQTLAYKIIRAQAEGRDDEALALAKDLQSSAGAKSQSSYTRNQLYSLLCATGYFDLAREMMGESDESSLSSYYHDIMRTDLWIERFEFPDSPKEQDRWISERIEKAIESKDLSSPEAREIRYLASRLEVLGEKEMAKRILTPLKEACRKAGGEVWSKFLARLSSSIRYPLLLEEIEDDWKEADYLRLMKRFASYRSEEREEFWELLGQVEGLSVKDRFQELSITFGWVKPPEYQRDALWKTMIARNKKHPELVDFFIKLGTWKAPLAIVGEAMLAREDRFEDLSEEDQWQTVENFVFQREWQIALRFMEKIETPEKTRPGLRVGILKRLNRHEKAAQTLQQALQACLILPEKLEVIARDLLLTGLQEEGKKLHYRMALELSPSSSAWQGNLFWLLRHAEADGNRQQASAMSEAMVCKIVRSNSWLTISSALEANLRLKLHRGLTIIDQGDQEKGRQMIDDAYQPMIGDPAVANTMVWSFKEADYPEIYDHLFQKSYQQFSKAIQKFPHHKQVRNSIAWLCAISGRHLEEAERHSLESVTNNPNYSYYDTLARIHREFGNFDEEFRLQELAVKHSPYAYFSPTSGILEVYDEALARQGKN